MGTRKFTIRFYKCPWLNEPTTAAISQYHECCRDVHLRRPRATVERSLKDSCRQNHVVLRGIVIGVHGRRGHAPSAEKIEEEQTVNPQLLQSSNSALYWAGQVTAGSTKSSADLYLLYLLRNVCVLLSQKRVAITTYCPTSKTQLTGFCREASSAGPLSPGLRSCSTA